GGPPEQQAAALAEGAATPTVMHLRWVGANPSPVVVTGTLLPGTVSYLRGNDPSKWIHGLSTYSGITYTNLYPGVSLAYYGSGPHLRTIFTLAPNADPGRIKWRFDGPTVSTDDKGSLMLTMDGGMSASGGRSGVRGQGSGVSDPGVRLVQYVPVASQ